jgi:hypothetical protein
LAVSGDQRNDKTYRAIAQRSPGTEPAPTKAPPANLSFTDALAFLYGRVPSQNRLAGILGVPRRTLRRWLDGAQPTAKDDRRRIVQESANRLVDAERAKIRQDNTAHTRAVRRARLSAQRERKLRGATKVIVKARMRYGNEETRTIVFHVGQGGSTGLRAGAVGDAIDAYLAGKTADDGPWRQNEGIFAPLVDAMTDPAGDDGYPGFFRDTGPPPETLGFDVEAVTFR